VFAQLTDSSLSLIERSVDYVESGRRRLSPVSDDCQKVTIRVTRFVTSTVTAIVTRFAARRVARLASCRTIECSDAR
jgi:hypothetical protein